MQRYIYILIFLFLSATLYSQNIKTKRLKKLSISEKAFFPEFGRDKNEIFITGKNHKGLVLYKVKSGDEIFITDELGAGDNPTIDKTGNISYNSISIENGKRRNKSKVYNIESKTVVKSALLNNNLRIKTEGKTIEILHPDNTKEVISPTGDVYYIWASLSPDNKHILYTAVGEGTFICDLKGKPISDLGYLNAPVWATQNWVIGMNDKDDGNRVISSEIVAVHINSNKKFILTDKEEIIALNPKVSKKAKRMVFHTPEGDIYYTKLRIRK